MESSKKIKKGQVTIPDASTTVKGIAKLYTSLGTNTDGSVDQDTLNTNFNLKAPLASPTFTGTVNGITSSMVGLGNVDNTSDVNKPVSTAQAAADAAIITTLRDGVITGGDTLQKLYNLIISSFTEVTVADIAARNALNVIAKNHVFVTDDGDGKWALYKATTSGVNATYVKLSDPDLLNAVMSASQIKTAYESNSDTNAFTNTLLSKLNAVDQNVSVIEKATWNAKQDSLTDVNFGAFSSGLTAKSTLVDADTFNISDSADSNKQKKVSLTNFKTFLKTYFDTIYTGGSAEPDQITITTSVNITTDTLDGTSKGQSGKNVVIDNGASAINITVNGGAAFCASYLKHGAGTITFVQGSGRTLAQVDGTAVLNGAVGSTATISSIGTEDYLRISNA